jgi:hypothetical protein
VATASSEVPNTNGLVEQAGEARDEEADQQQRKSRLGLHCVRLLPDLQAEVAGFA